jgi:hypothetical protein
MLVPLDAIRVIHNSLRRDMSLIDATAHIASRGLGSLNPVLERYILFNELLVWHTRGEEEYIFPALEIVAPLVAEAYERDHRGFDLLFEVLKKEINSLDILAIARATAAFEFHLGIHLNKEEAHLYRIFSERITISNQEVILGEMALERLPKMVPRLYPLARITDRKNITGIWRHTLPA